MFMTLNLMDQYDNLSMINKIFLKKYKNPKYFFLAKQANFYIFHQKLIFIVNLYEFEALKFEH